MVGWVVGVDWEVHIREMRVALGVELNETVSLNAKGINCNHL